MELAEAYPDDAEISFQTGVAHDNMGLETAAVNYYVRALEKGLTGKDLERCLLGLGSTYRLLGEYAKAEETLRRGVKEFPNHRGIQIFLAMTLYNSGQYKEALEISLTNLMETTADETLLYFKRPITYYATHLDEVL